MSKLSILMVLCVLSQTFEAQAQRRGGVERRTGVRVEENRPKTPEELLEMQRKRDLEKEKSELVKAGAGSATAEAGRTAVDNRAKLNAEMTAATKTQRAQNESLLSTLPVWSTLEAAHKEEILKNQDIIDQVRRLKPTLVDKAAESVVSVIMKLVGAVPGFNLRARNFLANLNDYKQSGKMNVVKEVLLRTYERSTKADRFVKDATEILKKAYIEIGVKAELGLETIRPYEEIIKDKDLEEVVNALDERFKKLLEENCA